MGNFLRLIQTRSVMQKAANSTDPLVMYIILNRSLAEKEKWPIGSMIAQACHAATKSLWTFKDEQSVLEYTSNINSMTKITLAMRNAEQLKKLGETFTEKNIEYVEWIEQPENILTCIATKPIRKSAVGTTLKKCSLYK